jgi:hypothetical protein
MKGQYAYTAKIKLTFAESNLTSDFTIYDMGYSPSSWDSMTDDQRRLELDNYVCDWSNKYIDESWSAR